MQIHELTQRRPLNEIFGFGGQPRYTTANYLDPATRLANTKKSPEMVQHVQKLADQWNSNIAPTLLAADYMTDLDTWVDGQIAVRDPVNGGKITLAAVANSTNPNNLKNELSRARKAVEDARGNPARTKTAVVDYLLTAIAGAQLLATVLQSNVPPPPPGRLTAAQLTAVGNAIRSVPGGPIPRTSDDAVNNHLKSLGYTVL